MRSLETKEYKDIFEPTQNAELHYQIWVEDEDSLGQSLEWLNLYDNIQMTPFLQKSRWKRLLLFKRKTDSACGKTDENRKKPLLQILSCCFAFFYFSGMQ